jgi:hypothetical protein
MYKKKYVTIVKGTRLQYRRKIDSKYYFSALKKYLSNFSLQELQELQTVIDAEIKKR